MPNFISEDAIEQAMLQRLEHLYCRGPRFAAFLLL